MTKKEFAVIVKKIKAAYSSCKLFEDEFSLNLWYSHLKDIGYADCEKSLTKHIQTSEFPPTIAELRRNPDSDCMTWAEAWRCVRSAITEYGSYRANEAVASLPETVAAAVRCIGFKEICISTNPEALCAQFRNTYITLANRNRELSSLPLPLLAQRGNDL